MELPKRYNPKEVEDNIYSLWEESGYFNPDNLPVSKDAEPFVVPIAPPNVTGSLHMGHALENTLVDLVVRRKRLQGYRALWIPGTDHAGIATQNKVEKTLHKEEGLTRFDLGRDAFIERVWQWKEKYGDVILNQLKRLGCSCDWSRTAFTMSDRYSKAVETAFRHYYEKGWIYRGERVVNWCSRCQTSLSDLELEHTEQESKLYYIEYPVAGEDDIITVATVRPETLLGDTAVAVNPDDDRHKDKIGKTAFLPLLNRELPIIADEAIDPEFGAGALKVTPAHDITDWEIAQRHDLPSVTVVGEDGNMTEESQLCEGLTPEECRTRIVEQLQEQGFLREVEEYTVSQPTCYRCDTIIEPIPSQQWFLNMETLAKHAIEAVESGRVTITPERYKRVYLDRLRNERDWCISRQLWWGHRIPIEGETDVLDTWFSSALWPFATLGWPDNTDDLQQFYPNTFVSSARDIIHLWIARMVFSGVELMEEVPFEQVYIHGTILTKDGQRMSKSLGTGIDPLELIDTYGSDATRFGLIWQATGVQDIRFDEGAMEMGQKFCNKIWNATRFAIGRIGEETLDLSEPPSAKTDADNIVLQKLEETAETVDKEVENMRFGQAAEALYHFFWSNVCDTYLEQSKEQLEDGTHEEHTKLVLLYVLRQSLILLHPFIPFVTEELYQALPITNKQKSLMVEEWPR